MPIERNIGSTLVDTRPVIRTTLPVEVRSPERVAALTRILVDAKEFSLDTADAVDSEGPSSTSCGGGKCANPCVQRCLPPPPPPRCR